MSSNNNKQFAFNQLIWIVVSIGISLAISRLLPFPISIVAIVGIFIALGYYMRKRTTGKMGLRGGLTGMSGSKSRAPGNNSLKYYCMISGTEHKQIECPKCGSKLKGWDHDQNPWILEKIRKNVLDLRPPKIRIRCLRYSLNLSIVFPLS